jgi:hypothetical protein
MSKVIYTFEKGLYAAIALDWVVRGRAYEECGGGLRCGDAIKCCPGVKPVESRKHRDLATQFREDLQPGVQSMFARNRWK